MEAPFLEGLGIGLSLAVPPGPINALIAQQAATHGWRRGALAGLAAPVVDTVYLALVVAALPTLTGAGSDSLLRGMALAGALLMAWLAWLTVRVRPAGAAPPERTFGQVLLVSLVNPFQLAWWLSAGPAFLAQKGALGVAGFLLGIYGWVLLFAFLVRKGALRWPWFTPVLEVLSADLLLLFALRLGLAASAGL